MERSIFPSRLGYNQNLVALTIIEMANWPTKSIMYPWR